MKKLTRVVAVGAAAPGAGCTLMATHLAALAAGDGLKTCVLTAGDPAGLVAAVLEIEPDAPSSLTVTAFSAAADVEQSTRRAAERGAELVVIDIGSLHEGQWGAILANAGTVVMMIDTSRTTFDHMAALGRWATNDPHRPLVCVLNTFRAAEADAAVVRDTVERLVAGGWRCLRTVLGPLPGAPGAADQFGRAAHEIIQVHDADLSATLETATARFSGVPAGRLKRGRAASSSAS